jgi:hypothetical protein
VPRGVCLFRQTDLKRALKGARAAGMEIARVEINKDGVIVIVPGKPSGVAISEETNEWNEVINVNAPTEIR